MLKRIFIIGVMLFFAHNCFAITAGDTSDPKTPYGPGIANMQASGLGPLKVSFDGDFVLDKDLEDKGGVTEAEINSKWGLCRIGYTFADRIEPYFKIGITNIETKWKEYNRHVKVKSETYAAGGFGGKILVFEIPEHKIRFTVDGQYLYANPDIKEARIDTTDRTISASEFEVTEWQIAGIVSMEFLLGYDKQDPAAVYSLIPYIGCAYFDSNTTTRFTASGTSYCLSNANNDKKVLMITGCDITSPKNAVVNVEGRWIGETAVNGGITLKF